LFILFFLDNEWSPEAAEVLHSLTNGLIIQAQVAGYTADGLPEVYLYACLAKDVSKTFSFSISSVDLFVLVNHGFVSVFAILFFIYLIRQININLKNFDPYNFSQGVKKVVFFHALKNLKILFLCFY
jgi:hypothetical protein